MQSRDEQLQRMLELIYDLLPDAEAAELRRQIEADPEMARQYAEARRTADKFAQAARIKLPLVPLVAPRDADESDSTPGAVAPLSDGIHAQKIIDSTHAPLRLAISPSPTDAAPTHRGVGSSYAPVTASPAERWWGRTARWAVAAAAMIVLAVTVGTYALDRMHKPDIARSHLRMIVAGPAKLQAGVTNQFTISTTSVTGEPIPVQVAYSLSSSDGRTLVEKKEQTDARGQLVAQIPADVPLTESSRFDVIAVHDGKIERMQTSLARDGHRFFTYLATDKPLYQPGETVYFRSLTLNRFGLDTPREMPIQFEIRDPSGAVVPNSTVEGITQHGVGNGAFVIPLDLAGGQYSLVARSLDDSFPEEKRSVFVRRYRLPRLKKELEFARDSYAPGETVVADFAAYRAQGGAAATAILRITATVDDHVVHQAISQATPAGTARIEFTLPEIIEKGAGQLSVAVDDGGTVETIAKTIRINLGKVAVRFFPEGGELVANLVNRVYFDSRSPVGEPMHIEGQVVDSRGQQVAQVETTHKGMGSFRLTPRSGETYKLKIAKPSDIQMQVELPAVVSDRHLTLTTGDGVFQPAQPITLDLLAERSNLPLVVSAYCRGVQVGQQTVTTEAGSNPVTLPITEGASGVIRLTVFDYGTSPPRPIAERLVYRRPDRTLKVQVAGLNDAYSPGETVDVSLVVTNESGSPVAAALGVAVVDDALLKLADDDSPQMSTHFYLTSEVERPEDLEKADFYLSDDAKAPVALDLLLGTQGWRRFIERKLEAGPQAEPIQRLAALGEVVTPPTLFDNLARVEAEYAAHRAAYEQERAERIERWSRLSVLGSVAVLIALVLLALGRLARGVPFWLPTLASAAASLVFALLWNGSDFSRAERTLARFRDATVLYATASTSPALVPIEFDVKMRDDALAVDELADQLAAKTFFAFDDRFALGAPEVEGIAEEMPGQRFARRLMPADVRLKRLLEAEVAEAGFGGRARLGYAPQLRVLRKRIELAKQLNDEAALIDAVKKMEESLVENRFTIREYAHTHVAGEPGVRSDFTETVFWHPLLIADSNGRTNLRFQLSDSVTTFRVLADGHDGSGRIGTGVAELVSRIPFSLEPKLPIEVNAGDRIDLPVAISNDTKTPLPVTLSLRVAGPIELRDSSERQLVIGPAERSRQYYALEVTGQKGQSEIELRGSAGSLHDAKRQSIDVVPPGFPALQSFSGRLAGSAPVTVTLPAELVPGSLEVSVAAFPSTLADLQKGIESILQEPNGCFEQASTSNYPNVLAMTYMQENRLANPEITRRTRELLKNGYARLTRYESPKQGYEWFGGDPGHEALTAYGLMQFRDMRPVFPVDESMLDRTAQWLLARRNGKGGFQRNPRALDSFGSAPSDTTDAYIVWALTESGQTGIETELQHVIELGKKSSDAYLVALAGASAANAQHHAAAKELLDKLAESQAADGHLSGTTSITRSGGVSLTAETTALAALAWLKLPAYHQNADKAVQWLVGHRQGAGGWGSTQATILALKALVRHAQINRKTVRGGELLVTLDGQVVGREPFGPNHDSVIAIHSIGDQLHTGENQLVLSLTGDNEMPYSLDVRYRTRVPSSDPNCPVRVATKLGADRARAGDTVAFEAEVANVTEEGQPMTVAILGLPAGLAARPDQLEELKKAGKIDYYETRAREITCYWRSLAPRAKVSLRFDLVAEWPGSYTAPASRTYLYYTAEQKHWTEPVSIVIARD